MKKNSDPSPEQIEQLTAEIRSGWSERERLSRLRSDQRPSVTLCDGRQHDIDAETYRSHHTQRAELQETGIPPGGSKVLSRR
jgi:hypothetical protein